MRRNARGTKKKKQKEQKQTNLCRMQHLTQVNASLREKQRKYKMISQETNATKKKQKEVNPKKDHFHKG